MHRTDLDRYREAQQVEREPRTLSFEEFPELLLGGPPLPTQHRVIWDDARLGAFKGPAGSAKTNTMACLAFMRALFQPGCQIFVSRYDYNDLLTTTAVDTQHERSAPS